MQCSELVVSYECTEFMQKPLKEGNYMGVVTIYIYIYIYIQLTKYLE